MMNVYNERLPPLQQNDTGNTTGGKNTGSNHYSMTGANRSGNKKAASQGAHYNKQLKSAMGAFGTNQESRQRFGVDNNANANANTAAAAGSSQIVGIEGLSTNENTQGGGHSLGVYS